MTEDKFDNSSELNEAALESADGRGASFDLSIKFSDKELDVIREATRRLIYDKSTGSLEKVYTM